MRRAYYHDSIEESQMNEPNDLPPEVAACHTPAGADWREDIASRRVTIDDVEKTGAALRGEPVDEYVDEYVEDFDWREPRVGLSPGDDFPETIDQAHARLGHTAPRVTLADLEANIVDVEIVKHVAKSGQVLRWAVLTTRNGFAVAGEPSASVSKENDSEELGSKFAIENSRRALWPLMGYALREHLHDVEVLRSHGVGS